MKLLEASTAEVKGESLIIGPVSRGVVVRVPVVEVLKALVADGFCLVPKEFVEMFEAAVEKEREKDE